MAPFSRKKKIVQKGPISGHFKNQKGIFGDFFDTKRYSKKNHFDKIFKILLQNYDTCVRFGQFEYILLRDHPHST